MKCARGGVLNIAKYISSKNRSHNMFCGNAQQLFLLMSQPTKEVLLQKRRGYMASVISLPADWPGTTGGQWSTITTVDQGRKGEKKGHVLPRQLRHCVKHFCHGDWRVCVGMSCTNMSLCMWQWAAAWQENVWRQLIRLLCSASDEHWV